MSPRSTIVAICTFFMRIAITSSQQSAAYGYPNQCPAGTPPYVIINNFSPIPVCTPYGFPNPSPIGASSYGFPNPPPIGASPYGSPNPPPIGASPYGSPNPPPIGAAPYGSPNPPPIGAPTYGFPNPHPIGASPYGSPNPPWIGAAPYGSPNPPPIGAPTYGFPNSPSIGVPPHGVVNNPVPCSPYGPSYQSAPGQSFWKVPCSNEECIHAASRILTNRNLKVDPCDDFYEHVCGNYPKENMVPDDMPGIIPLSLSLEREIPSRLQQIIEDIDESIAPSPFQDLKISYKRCTEREWNMSKNLSIDATERPSVTKLWENVHTLRTNESELAANIFAEPAVLYRLDLVDNKLREKFLLAEWIFSNNPWEFLKEGMTNPDVKNYLTFMKFVLTDLGVDQMQDSDQAEVVNFEIELAKAVSPDDEDSLFYDGPTEITVGTLKNDYPSLRFENKMNMADTVVVLVDNLKIFANLNALINRTSKSILANWISWQRTIHQDRIKHLGPEIYHKYESLFIHNRMGFYHYDGLRRKCAQEVYESFPNILETLYYGQHITKEAMNSIKAIFQSIKGELIESIQKADWLSESTKQHAIKKVRNIWITNGEKHEDYMLDKESNPHYVDLKISNGLLAENRANLTKIKEHSFDMQINPLIKQAATYSALQNVLILGAAMYSDAYFNAYVPLALNYGAIGSVMGHEIGHSVGHIGKFLNETTSVPHNPSWDRKSLENYAARTRCLGSEYKKHAFNEFGFNVTTTRTANEDIADVIGIKSAYLAFKKYHPFGQELPGLFYTPEQQFWVSSATTWCSKFSRETMLYKTYADPHNLEKLRVNVPLSNLQEFANDFKCKVGSKMNPVDKCTIF